jgi:hypothetical protein
MSRPVDRVRERDADVAADADADAALRAAARVSVADDAADVDRKRETRSVLMPPVAAPAAWVPEAEAEDADAVRRITAAVERATEHLERRSTMDCDMWVLELADVPRADLRPALKGETGGRTGMWAVRDGSCTARCIAVASTLSGACVLTVCRSGATPPEGYLVVLIAPGDGVACRIRSGRAVRYHTVDCRGPPPAGERAASSRTQAAGSGTRTASSGDARVDSPRIARSSAPDTVGSAGGGALGTRGGGGAAPPAATAAPHAKEILADDEGDDDNYEGRETPRAAILTFDVGGRVFRTLPHAVVRREGEHLFARLAVAAARGHSDRVSDARVVPLGAGHWFVDASSELAVHVFAYLRGRDGALSGLSPAVRADLIAEARAYGLPGLVHLLAEQAAAAAAAAAAHSVPFATPSTAPPPVSFASPRVAPPPLSFVSPRTAPPSSSCATPPTLSASGSLLSAPSDMSATFFARALSPAPVPPTTAATPSERDARFRPSADSRVS